MVANLLMEATPRHAMVAYLLMEDTPRGTRKINMEQEFGSPLLVLTAHHNDSVLKTFFAWMLCMCLKWEKRVVLCSACKTSTIAHMSFRDVLLDAMHVAQVGEKGF